MAAIGTLITASCCFTPLLICAVAANGFGGLFRFYDFTFADNFFVVVLVSLYVTFNGDNKNL
jgi:hypothetical protein